MSDKLSQKHLEDLLGQEIGLSDWMEITQERINDFADCTEDHQWIHVDLEKAKKGPLKSTVAHGFLLLSLLPHLNWQIDIFNKEIKMAVNYGLDRVRFIHPVKPGDRIRSRSLLKTITKRGFRRVLLSVESTLEIEGKKKPALVAELLVLVYLKI
ncbi:MAG: MaoC family dehydratase [Candidatus Aminicenantes bacterium]|nr:MaoC family dehydratase [Candidatus Aminicenantes bacterium]